MSSTLIDLKYHIIITTRNQEALIQEPRRVELYRYVHGIVRNHDSRAIQIGGMSEHLHLLLGIHPQIAVADMLRLIKSNSSKWLNERGQGRGWFGWQAGYLAFTVSPAQIEKVKHFIVNQTKIHRSISFHDEQRQLIEKHEIELEDRHFDHRPDSRAWLAFHVVFSTKNRMRWITSSRKKQVFDCLTALVTEQSGRIVEIGGMPDHVHLLIELPRTVAVADAVKKIKSVSSQQLSSVTSASRPLEWQRGYGAFSVSKSQVPVVARYIQRQEEHHQERTLDDELRSLMQTM